MNKTFEWLDFYREFASRLLEYKNRRKDLVSQIEKVFQKTGIKMPEFEKENSEVDVDPFTIFGLFNRGLTDENRIKIASAIRDQFSLYEETPASFDGVPLLQNQNAFFYRYGSKKEVFENLWSLFEYALKYAEHKTDENKAAVSKYFDLVINEKGNGNSKVTMGLFWIAPDVFLNLDSRNEWYIYKSGRIPQDVVESLPPIDSTGKLDSDTYFKITDRIQEYLGEERSTLKDFVSLSYEAWVHSTEVNNQVREARNDDVQKGSGLADEDVETRRYWLYSPGDGASKWEKFHNDGVMGLGWKVLGDLTKYSSKEEMKAALKSLDNPNLVYRNAAHATWQFANDIKIGDVVYVKEGRHTLIGRGVVESDYFYDSSYDEEYPNLRKVNWTHVGKWEHPGNATVKTLTDVTPYTVYCQHIKELFETEEDEEEEVEETFTSYSPEEFLEQVYISRKSYETLVGLLESKKNVILQGAPGVGKTYIAKRLAYSIIGSKDQNRVMMVQFHQSYSYEDFIEGFRPSMDGSGFEIRKGSFYNFCRRAQEDIDNKYFFIIDEINRGNLSKIFGELFMLIEKDKRDNDLQLLYSNEWFRVPRNVYIIGMMNTADRSLAMMDYALRRRFGFFPIAPGFRSEGFIKYKESLNSRKFDSLITCVEDLNARISQDSSLGEGYCIGHSYFCELKEVDDVTLSNIVEYELIPLLSEYWYDEPGKVRDWSERLRASIQ